MQCHLPRTDRLGRRSAGAVTNRYSRERWAPWCEPCRAMAPAFERAAVELEPGYRLLKVDTEEEPTLAARYEIRSIPMLMLFVGGNPVARRAGASDTRGIVSWARTHGSDKPPSARPN
jgi:thioredoxin-like negative regulator of GroEL